MADTPTIVDIDAEYVHALVTERIGPAIHGHQTDHVIYALLMILGQLYKPDCTPAELADMVYTMGLQFNMVTNEIPTLPGVH